MSWVEREAVGAARARGAAARVVEYGTFPGGE